MPAHTSTAAVAPVQMQTAEDFSQTQHDTTFQMRASFQRGQLIQERLTAFSSLQLTAANQDEVYSFKFFLQKLLPMASTSLPTEEIQRLCEVTCDVHDQPTWNWCVRLGSVLSVAAALGAVYVRCGRSPHGHASP